MAYLAKWRIENQLPRYRFFCIGCDEDHWINDAWTITFDGDIPTVEPSILVTKPMKTRTLKCHSFIRNGKIEYLNDSFHRLAGSTVDMVEVSDEPK